MGTVEILPDLMVYETGSKTLGGGAGSSLVALNDATDATYVQAAGTLAQSWSGWFRFAVPGGIPAGAVIERIQMRVRYSHWKKSATQREIIQPVTILVGRQSGSKHIYDGFTLGEKVPSHSTLTTPVQVWTGPFRKQFHGSNAYIGRQLLIPGRRIYGTVAVIRSGTIANTARIYSFSLLVHYNEVPVVTVTQPSGTEVISRPPFEWTFDDTEADPQLAYDVRLYHVADANNAQFDIEDMVEWPPVYRRVVNSTQLRHQIETGFGEDGETFAAFVSARHRLIIGTALVTDRGKSPLSAWDRNDFTLDIATPLPPLVTAAYSSVLNGIVVDVEGFDNMLSWNQSSIEVDTAGFASVNTTHVKSSTQFLHGSFSIRMERITSTGDANLITSPVTDVPIEVGKLYTGRASFRAVSTSRTCRVLLQFWDAAGGNVAATNTQHDITDVSTGWREAFTTAIAPAGAVSASLDCRALAAVVGEQHYVDQLGIFPERRTSMLTENSASAETSSAGWGPGTNTTVAQDLTQSYRGKASLKITRTTSTGDAFADATAGSTPVIVGQQYTAQARFRANVATRSVRVAIRWLDGALGFLSESTGSNVTDTTTGWTLATVTGTAPASAVTAQVRITVVGALATEFHFMDWAGIWHGTVGGEIHYWTQGGFLHHEAPEHFTELQRSTDAGVTWETLPAQRVKHLPIHQSLEYVDYQAPSNSTVNYRARIEAENQDGDLMNSGWSNLVAATMPVFTSWYLRDPLDPGIMTMKIRMNSAKLRPPKPNSVDYPIGSDSAVMTHDGVRKDDLDCVIDLLNEADYTTFRKLIDSGLTLLLQDTFGRQWYVQPDDGIEYEILLSQKLLAEVWPTRHVHRVSIRFISVEKPRTLGMATSG